MSNLSAIWLLSHELWRVFISRTISYFEKNQKGKEWKRIYLEQSKLKTKIGILVRKDHIFRRSKWEKRIYMVIPKSQLVKPEDSSGGTIIST